MLGTISLHDIKHTFGSIAIKKSFSDPSFESWTLTEILSPSTE